MVIEITLAMVCVCVQTGSKRRHMIVSYPVIHSRKWVPKFHISNRIRFGLASPRADDTKIDTKCDKNEAIRCPASINFVAGGHGWSTTNEPVNGNGTPTHGRLCNERPLKNPTEKMILPNSNCSNSSSAFHFSAVRSKPTHPPHINNRRSVVG